MHSNIRRALALAAIATALPLVAQAQGFERNTKLGVFAGATIPTGDMGQGVSTGFNLGALIEAKPAMSPVGLRADGTYNRFGFKNGGGNSTAWALTGNAVLSPTASPLYVIGGVGLYSFTDSYDADFTGTKASVNSGTKFGFNVGAGLHMPLTGFDTFVEARWHSVSTPNNAPRATFIPISFGVRF